MLLTYSTMFLILASIIVFTRKKDFFSKFKSGTDYIYGIGYAFTVMFVSAIVMNICSIFYNAQDNTNQTTATLVATNYPLLSFIVIGFLGPICEELTYRVGLYSFLRRINKYVAIIATSLVFAFIHFEVGAENIVNELWSMPAYFVSGLIFCIAYEHRGPACSITAHMVYNMLAFIMMFVQK